MKHFYELTVLFKIPSNKALEDLGIEVESPGNWDVALIDLDAIESVTKAREADGADFSEVNITTESGDEFTVKMPYEQFKNLLAKELLK